jgi:hypothetical protein
VEVAKIVRKKGKEEVERLRRGFQDLKSKGLEPLEVGWNPLKMLNCSHDEPAWTQWFAAVLQTPVSCDVTWRALLSVAGAAAAKAEPDQFLQKEALLGALQKARQEAQYASSRRIVPEALTTDGGHIDIFIESTDLVVGIENKLWAGWHDRPGNPQDMSYLRWLKKIAGKRQAVSIFLSIYAVTKETEEYRKEWLFVTWGELAIALRREIGWKSIDGPPNIDLLPAVLTISAIEQNLLMLHAPRANDTGHWSELENMTKVVRHLEEAHADGSV